LSKILITGAKGFIGSSVTRFLDAQGFKIFPIDKEYGDITNYNTLKKLEDFDFRHVIHLAGKTYVPASWENPLIFYNINFTGTANVLEFCRKKGCNLTHLSSYLYGQPKYLPIDENHPIESYNPYSHSKILADNVCQFYMQHYGTSVTILRAFNIYGPDDPKSFLIPEIVKMVKDNSVKEIQVMDLRPKRDYIFIDDLVDAIARTIDGPRGIFNVGSGYSVSVEELINIIMQISGIKKAYRSMNKERKNEIFDLYANIGKIANDLGWKPHTSLEEGLRFCI